MDFVTNRTEIVEDIVGSMDLGDGAVACRVVVMKDATLGVSISRKSSASEAMLARFGPGAADDVQMDGVRGRTKDGTPFCLTGTLRVLDGSTSVGSEGWAQRLDGHFDGSLEFGESGRGSRTAPRSWEFDLVNLALRGIEMSERGTGGFWRDTVNLQLGDAKVQLRQMENYEEVKRELRWLHGVGVTFTARVEGVADDEGLHVIEKLCCLLTLATGSLVTWSASRTVDAEGAVTCLRYRSAITRGYRRTCLLPNEKPEVVKSFVERAWPLLQRLEGVVGLRRLAHAWSDLGAAAFLETRALIAASLMDLLTGRVRAACGIVDLIPPREPYRVRLKSALDLLGVTPSVDLKDVVDIRNAIVHETTLGRGSRLPVESFSTLLALLGEMVLALYRYEGPATDWTQRAERELHLAAACSWSDFLHADNLGPDA